MDKELLKYMNHESNIYVGQVKITRDQVPNGMEYIRVCLQEDSGEEKELYAHFHNPAGKKKKSPKQKGADPPKHTGGKPPYLMLMVNEIEKLREKDVKNVEELVGYIVCLGKYIEWNTGRLIHKRSKRPLKYTDLQKIYKCSKPKLNKMIGLMKEYELINSTDDGYFVSPRYIKKGQMHKEDDRDVL